MANNPIGPAGEENPTQRLHANEHDAGSAQQRSASDTFSQLANAAQGNNAPVNENVSTKTTQSPKDISELLPSEGGAGEQGSDELHEVLTASAPHFLIPAIPSVANAMAMEVNHQTNFAEGKALATSASFMIPNNKGQMIDVRGAIQTGNNGQMVFRTVFGEEFLVQPETGRKFILTTPNGDSIKSEATTIGSRSFGASEMENRLSALMTGVGKTAVDNALQHTFKEAVKVDKSSVSNKESKAERKIIDSSMSDTTGGSKEQVAAGQLESSFVGMFRQAFQGIVNALNEGQLPGFNQTDKGSFRQFTEILRVLNQAMGLEVDSVSESIKSLLTRTLDNSDGEPRVFSARLNQAQQAAVDAMISGGVSGSIAIDSQSQITEGTMTVSQDIDIKPITEEQLVQEIEETVLQEAFIESIEDDKVVLEESEIEKTPKKDPERRKRYTIVDGDTLESIASKKLADSKLAPLIFEINQKVIPNKTVKKKIEVILKPKVIIWLPTPTEIQDFREHSPIGQRVKFAYPSASETLEEEFSSTIEVSESIVPAKEKMPTKTKPKRQS